MICPLPCMTRGQPGPDFLNCQPSLVSYASLSCDFILLLFLMNLYKQIWFRNLRCEIDKSRALVGKVSPACPPGTSEASLNNSSDSKE